jgi:hypothetical protein
LVEVVLPAGAPVCACPVVCVCVGRLEVLKPHNKPITAIEFNPQGTMLATGCQDGSVFLLSAELSQSEIGPVPHFTCVGPGVHCAPPGPCCGVACALPGTGHGARSCGADACLPFVRGRLLLLCGVDAVRAVFRLSPLRVINAPTVWPVLMPVPWRGPGKSNSLPSPVHSRGCATTFVLPCFVRFVPPRDHRYLHHRHRCRRPSPPLPPCPHRSPIGFVSFPGPVTSLAWHPTLPELLATTADGLVVVLPVPRTFPSTTTTFELPLPFSTLKVMLLPPPRLVDAPPPSPTKGSAGADEGGDDEGKEGGEDRAPPSPPKVYVQDEPRETGAALVAVYHPQQVCCVRKAWVLVWGLG